jgi:hypothetical protein
MDTSDLASVAARYYALRGLLLLPTGLLFIAAGLFNMPPIGDEPVSNMAWYFLGAVALAAVGYFAFNRYYLTTFGRVDPSTRTKVHLGVYTALAALGIAAGISIDTQFDLPVTTFGVAFGVSLLIYYRVMVGLRIYHWAFLGGVALLSLVPVWGRLDDKVSIVMIPIGVATIGVGLFDHRDLVTSIRLAQRAVTAGEVNAHTT